MSSPSGEPGPIEWNVRSDAPARSGWHVRAGSAPIGEYVEFDDEQPNPENKGSEQSEEPAELSD